MRRAAARATTGRRGSHATGHRAGRERCAVRAGSGSGTPLGLGLDPRDAWLCTFALWPLALRFGTESNPDSAVRVRNDLLRAFSFRHYTNVRYMSR